MRFFGLGFAFICMSMSSGAVAQDVKCEPGAGVDQPYIWPVDGPSRVSAHYNPDRINPVTNRASPHQGIDISASRGTPVRAAKSGKVLMARFYGGFGHHIRLNHSAGQQTWYAHMDRRVDGLKNGDCVARGQVIGFVGSTGRSTGDHLHFEVRIDGTPQDPRKYIFHKDNGRAAQE